MKGERMAEEEKIAPQAQAEAPPVKEVVKETKEPKEAKEKEGGRSQNCTQCKKRLSRKQWYYRDGNYFCSKGCWKASKEKKAA